MCPLTRSAAGTSGNSVSEPYDPTGDHLPHPQGFWRATTPRDRHRWRPELSHSQGHRVDQGELREDDQGGGSRAYCRDEHVHSASSFPSPDFNEPAAVTK